MTYMKRWHYGNGQISVKVYNTVSPSNRISGRRIEKVVFRGFCESNFLKQKAFFEFRKYLVSPLTRIKNTIE